VREEDLLSFCAEEGMEEQGLIVQGRKHRCALCIKRKNGKISDLSCVGV
jgi:hypothetical protein